MRNPIFSFILVFLIFTVGDCFANERFTNLTIKDGLSQSSVKCLFQDSKGFIWAGTADGLNRYDGYEFTTYRFDPKNPKSIGGNDISCIYENPTDSTLWIGTQDAGLFYYNRNTNSFISVGNNQNSGFNIIAKHIKDMLSTSDGKLWIATNTSGLISYNPADSSFTQPKFSSSNNKLRNINRLQLDNLGNLWLGTPGGLYKWPPELRAEGKPPLPTKITLSSSQPQINALNIDVKGNLWIGTLNKGLFVFHPQSIRLKNYLNDETQGSISSNHVNDIVVTASGTVWIATNDGLCKYNAEKDNFVVSQNIKNDPESLNNNSIYCLINDNSGILWIGTLTGGINKLDSHQYRFPKYNSFGQNNSTEVLTKDIRSIHTDKNGKLWLGTANELLEIHGEDFGTNISSINRIKTHLAGSYLGATTSIANGILVSCQGKILHIDNDGKQSDFSKQIENKTGVYITGFNRAVYDDYNNLWLATVSGLLKYDQSKADFELFNPKGPDSESLELHPSALFSDHAGKLWIGTYNALLYTFDIHTKTFELIFSGNTGNRQTSLNKIFSICETEPDNIWFGTDRGLYFLNAKNRKTQRLLDSDGLANNVVYAAIADNNAKVWCSTNMGISCYDTQTKKFQNYTYDDGLQSNEFNEGSFYKDKNGFIYMGGIEGLNIFDPNKITPNPFVPPVIITGMEIQYKEVTSVSNPEITNNQISETKELTLNHKQNAISFKFTALSYSLSKRNKYKYTLTKNEDADNWIEAGHRRIASYTNIPPGEYLFKVMGSNSDGLWNEKPTTIAITIEPPYWKRLWFRILLIYTFLTVIFLIYHVRIRNIHKQKKILKRLVVEKTKTLVTQTKRIERQNLELQQTTSNIKEKNEQLNEQHIQIQHQNEELLEMAEKVDEANKTKLSFFTSISHEFRTPLTLITGPLKNLIENIDSTNPKELKRKLSNIYTNSSKLLLIVNQLLDFRKAETDTIEMRISEIDLVSFVHKTSSLFNDMARQKKFHFGFSSSSEQLSVFVDTDMLEKIIYNILSNAFKYTSEGGSVDVQVSTTEEKGSTYAILTIADNGIGIEEHKLPYIFNRFYQSKQVKKLPDAGSGLGLALVAKYVELHKGDIKVNSEPGTGTEFVIRLPLGKKHFDSNVVFDKQEFSQRELLSATIGDYMTIPGNEIVESEKNDKATLLVIEDDYNLRAYLKEILSAEYIVLEADTAKKGFQLAETKHPDAIISDVKLPDSNGFELCAKIKSEFQTSHLPVILLTSLADKESRLSGIKSGADYFITKPFDLKHLLLSVENLIEGRLRLQRKYGLTDPDNINQLVSNSKDQMFLKEAIKVIDKNIVDSSFNVELFCEQMKLSQPQCYRKIKAITGFNISEFIRNTRLKKAAKLLKSGDYKINEVAYETGFNDPNYFTKCFTKLFGVTPSDYTKS